MNFKIERQPMISGVDEVETERYFRMLKGKEGRIWFVAIEEEAAEHVYVSIPGDSGRGFGGRELTFKVLMYGQIANPRVVKVKGPWHSNSDALFDETGYDVRNRYRTFVVVSRTVEYTKEGDVMVDVLYKDEAPMLGIFSRGDGIAQKLANELKTKVVLYSQSRGGSSITHVHPETVKEEDNVHANR